MPLASGARLGPYQVVGPIGSGGMGEVYRARDTRLDRTVAIKVLAEAFSSDESRRSRFEREAKAIAALPHPNICTVYDIGEHDGVRFLVMELLEGETLAARLSRGPMPMPELIARATEIAEGLDCAHRAGIVHRDLKPANVMLTRTGAKLLDFGLASVASGRLVAAESETAPGPLTQAGELLGTIPYMAPEQLHGEPVDARTDVFALGAILHEMATGQRAFSATSQAGLVGAILHELPAPLTALVAHAPPALERLITTCLAKDPANRWSSAHDVALLLGNLADVPEAAGAGTSGSRSASPFGGRLAWIAAVAAIALFAAGMWFLRSTGSREPGTVDLLAVVPPDNTTFVRGEAPQMSPDGRLVAFAATDSRGVRGLYLRSRSSADVRMLAGTENCAQPFWSPDSRRLGFFAEGQLKTVAIDGGSPAVIARAFLPRGAAWSRDNLILFSQRPNTALVYVPASGGTPTPVPTPQKMGIPGFPAFLPDGRHYLFTELHAETRLAESIWLGSLDAAETRRLVASTSNGVFASGHLLFRRNTTLVAQAFDLETLQLSGEPVSIAENVGFNPVTYQALFSASTTGALAYRDATPGTELVWFDRAGTRLSTAVPAGDYNAICLTPDDRRLVFDRADPLTGNIDLWTVDLASAVLSQLTFAGPVEFYPACSPNGAETAFARLQPNVPNLFRQSLLSPGQAVLVLDTPVAKIPTGWKPDGTELIYTAINPQTGGDIETAPVAGGEKRTLVATRAEERTATLSPDGRWLAYVSNESGRFEVYVQPNPPSGGKWLVSKGGGLQPKWRADGNELYYVSPDRSLMAVNAGSDGAVFSPTDAVKLMNTRITEMEVSNQGWAYAVTRDGHRFLISTSTDVGRPITMILNWTASLRP